MLPLFSRSTILFRSCCSSFLALGSPSSSPIVMYGISLTGAISPSFWRVNFRYAALLLVIFGALITPDGSGVTMWFIAIPMVLLYLAGMLIVERRAARLSSLGN